MLPQAGKRPHIWRIEKDLNPTATSPAIRDTGCMSDYHTLDYKDSEKNRRALEQFLSPIEGEQAVFIQAICKDNTIPDASADLLANLVSSLRYRVPAFKKYVDSFMQKAVGNTLNHLYSRGRLPKPPPVVEKLIEEVGIDSALRCEISNWIKLKYMMEMAFTNKTAVTFIRQMNAQLYIAPPNRYFITCDDPVAIFHSDYARIKPYGVGLATKGIEVSVPISRKHLIKLTWEGTEGVVQATPAEVCEYNRRSIVMAKTQIFSPEKDDQLLNEIGALSHSFAGYRLSNLKHENGSVMITTFIPVE